MAGLPFRLPSHTADTDDSPASSHITSIDLPLRPTTDLPSASTAYVPANMVDRNPAECTPYEPLPIPVDSRAQTANDWRLWVLRFHGWPRARIRGNFDSVAKHDTAGWDWRDFEQDAVAPFYELGDSRTKVVVRLEQNDTLGAARELRRRGITERIGVVCHANASTPGGGFMDGASGEEEDFCHLTTLYPRLHPNKYPIYDYQMLHAEDVWVMKEKASGVFGGRALPESEWYHVDVLSATPAANPPTDPFARQDRDGTTVTYDCYRDPADRLLMENKIRHILMLAMKRNMRRLVIGAFGCGESGHPAREVAQIMKDLLIGSDDYDGPEFNFPMWRLREIVIAIDDSAPGKPVWNDFMKVFRQDKGMHTANHACEPETAIQYTSFAPGYGAAD